MAASCQSSRCGDEGNQTRRSHERRVVWECCGYVGEASIGSNELRGLPLLSFSCSLPLVLLASSPWMPHNSLIPLRNPQIFSPFLTKFCLTVCNLLKRQVRRFSRPNVD
jgi:hypothetical protein